MHLPVRVGNGLLAIKVAARERSAINLKRLLSSLMPQSSAELEYGEPDSIVRLSQDVKLAF